MRPDSARVHSSRDPVCAADENLLPNPSGFGDDLVRATTSLLGEACAIILERAVKLDEVFFALWADGIRVDDSRRPTSRARDQHQRKPLPSRRPFYASANGQRISQRGARAVGVTLGRACLSRALIVGHPEAGIRRIVLGDNAGSAVGRP